MNEAGRSTEFIPLNDGWDAEPNAPDPHIRIDDSRLLLSFFLNSWANSDFRKFDRGELAFQGCWRYRLGATNDEGWYRGECRFNRRAPEWGKFYEIRGDLRLERAPQDWIAIAPHPQEGSRHFLFYFRDETFECDAATWSFRVLRVTDTGSNDCVPRLER